MGKKCLPGVICIENMTLFLLFVIAVILIYIFYNTTGQKSTIVVLSNDLGKTRDNNTMMTPPENHMYDSDLVQTFPEIRYGSGPELRTGPEIRYGSGPEIRQGPDIRPRPNINIETRGTNQSYSQIGILTRPGINAETLILPLMGRRLDSGRNKMQYYTVSNTGNMNTKLPISKDGRSCTGEYGCDEVFNGDTVYVEGYADTFKATIYENSRFNYIPSIM
jgi:hypothetical protein